MSTTARHGSEKFRVQRNPDSCHRGLEHTVVVLLMQPPSKLAYDPMIAAVTRHNAKLVPIVVRFSKSTIFQKVMVRVMFCAGVVASNTGTTKLSGLPLFRRMTVI
jgi:hypothetical protein